MFNFIKITNFVQSNGEADYKGLDLSKIVGGSQLYPGQENVVYFFYDGEVAEGKDVSIISQANYDSVKQQMANNRQPSPIEKIEQLEIQQGDLLMEIALLKMGGNA